jgi:hypothetical protein
MTRRAALAAMAATPVAMAEVFAADAPPKARRIATPEPPPNPDARALLDNVARRAFAFFWNESHPETGLTKDRAHNLASAGPDTYTVASTASTGYALAALAIGAERGWVGRADAADRARLTLRYLTDRLPHEHGFFYHFVDWRTGERQWKSELSSIDTGLLLLGVLAAGAYFGGDIRRAADALYARVDWRWMRDGVPKSQEGRTFPTLSMGWRPETGFLDARWATYDEGSYLYLLALGAPVHDLPGEAWDAWGSGDKAGPKPVSVEGFPVYGGPGPLFFAQMTPAYYDLRGMRDRAGRDLWTSFANAHKANHAYCDRHPDRYPKLKRGALWGITACDQPPAKPGEGNGYGAQEPLDGENDGTVAPTAALAGVVFVPDLAERAALDLYNAYKDRAWGRHGFSNALNPTKGWFDGDVIGIDLGMMLLALENRRSGLIWRLMAGHPATKKALAAAGLRKP